MKTAKEKKTQCRYDRPDKRLTLPVEAKRADHEAPEPMACLEYLRLKFKGIYHIWSSIGPEFDKWTHTCQIGHIQVSGEDLLVVLRKCVELHQTWMESEQKQEAT